MIKNNSIIEKLRNDIYAALKKEIGKRDVCLLDLPNYYNPGDQLIQEGEEQLLKYLGINIKYRASRYFFNPQMISKKDCILLHGGGNFGDLYYYHQKFKENVIKKFPNNKIIILSSTVFFLNKNTLKRTKKLFSEHKNLVICARDKKSFTFIKKNFQNNKCLLVPDSAFAISNFKKLHKKSLTKNVIFINRNDKEKEIIYNSYSFRFIKNLDISDWPTFNQSTLRSYFSIFCANVNRIILKLINCLGLHWNSQNDIYGLIKIHSKEQQIKSAIEFLSKYELIITTRLHGHILACLLGIPNIILDNSYGKNKNFYQTWMSKNSSNAYYANSVMDVKKIIAKNFPRLLKNIE